MTYGGSERRRRFVYVTRNTEYHTQDGLCVAVRDKRSGAWLEEHSAVTLRIEGGVRTMANGCVLPTMEGPTVGDPMYFVLGREEDDWQLVTSRIEAIERPERGDLQIYPRLS
jgi:hypothetical protein